MKFYSKIFKAKVITSIFIVIWLLILLLITINNTLSCVDTNGKLKSHCDDAYDEMRNSYKRIVEKMKNN